MNQWLTLIRDYSSKCAKSFPGGKMRTFGLVVGSVLVLASTNAVAFEKHATTPSGRPEMVFAFTPLNTAVSQVSSGCMDNGWAVFSQSNNQVVCEVPMGLWQSVLTNMVIGNQYSTPAKQFVRVSLTQVGDHTRAQTQSWAETQMAFGQIQQQPYNDDGTYNNMLTFLAQSGAQFPVGTTFTSAPYLGVDGEAGSWQNGRRQAFGWTLTRVVDNAPAQKLGMQVGDVITKVNNRPFRDAQGFTNVLDRARVGQPLTITVMRNGVEQTFSTIAEGRPTITTLVRPDQIPEGETGVAMQMMAALMGGIPQAQQAAGMAPAKPVEAESELHRLRREAIELQTRLAEAEAAASATPVKGSAAETPVVNDMTPARPATDPV